MTIFKPPDYDKICESIDININELADYHKTYSEHRLKSSFKDLEQKYGTHTFYLELLYQLMFQKKELN